jgi:hypothetical protein
MEALSGLSLLSYVNLREWPCKGSEEIQGPRSYSLMNGCLHPYNEGTQATRYKHRMRESDSVLKVLPRYILSLVTRNRAHLHFRNILLSALEVVDRTKILVE